MSNFGYKQKYDQMKNLEVDTIENPDGSDQVVITTSDLILGKAGASAEIHAAAADGSTAGASLALKAANGTSSAPPTDIYISAGNDGGNGDSARVQITAGSVTSGSNDAGNIVLTPGITFGSGDDGRLEINGTLDIKRNTTTQSTNITTAVTVNRGAGAITTQAATAAADATNVFTVNNSVIKSDDNVLLTIQSYGGSSVPVVSANNITDGSFDIVIGNAGGAALDAALVIYFLIC